MSALFAHSWISLLYLAAVSILGLGFAHMALLRQRAGPGTGARDRASKETGSSAAVPKAPAAAEQRQDLPRSRRWHHLVFAHVDRPGQFCTGWVTDVSRGGVGVILFRRMAIGSVWKIQPTTAAESAPWARVQVRYCIPRARNTWSIGCLFLDDFRDSVLRA